MDYSQASGGSIGKFNEGMFITMRTHELQSIINNCKLNPDQFNIRYGRYNYEVLFKALVALFSESSAKFAKAENEVLLKFDETITSFIKKFPIHTKKKKVGGSSQVNININNFEELLDHLKIYELILKGYRDKHGLSNPNELEEEGYD